MGRRRVRKTASLRQAKLRIRHRPRFPAPLNSPLTRFSPPPARPARDRRRRPAAARTAARRVAPGSVLTATSRAGPGRTRTRVLSGAGGCGRGAGQQQREAGCPAGRSSPTRRARKLGPSLRAARGEGAGGAAPGRPYRPVPGWSTLGLDFPNVGAGAGVLGGEVDSVSIHLLSWLRGFRNRCLLLRLSASWFSPLPFNDTLCPARPSIL